MGNLRDIIIYNYILHANIYVDAYLTASFPHALLLFGGKFFPASAAVPEATGCAGPRRADSRLSSPDGIGDSRGAGIACGFGSVPSLPRPGAGSSCFRQRRTGCRACRRCCRSARCIAGGRGKGDGRGGSMAGARQVARQY